MHKKGITLMLSLIFTLFAATNVFATEADYYDTGWYKTSAGYVNNNGEIVEGVIKKGVDVSCYQGDIDWKAVANDGIDFAFIRIGNFKSGLDKCFTQNINGALDNGIQVGLYVYSYAMTPEVAKMEADFILSAAKKYPISYPIAFDIEDSWHKNLTREELQAIVDAFCGRVEEAGYYPIVYTSKSWFINRIGPVDWYTWVAQYNNSCDCTDMAFWQCTSHGKVNGIEGRCDINFQFMDFSEVINKDGWRIHGDNIFYMEDYMPHYGWLEADGFTYYCDLDTGAIVYGKQNINGEIYYFNKYGELMD